jgi:hypothetical protein
MNLKKAEKNLTELLNKQMGLEFSYKTEDSLLVASCDIGLFEREKAIACTVWVFESGTVIFSFLLGKVPYTAMTLDTVSRFNSEVAFFKATMNSGTLNVLHEAYAVEEKQLTDYVKGIFGIMVSNDLKKNMENLFFLCDSAEEVKEEQS